MSVAKDALIDLHADILCLQEVRDWGSVGDFNTDPTDLRFASEQTFAILREKPEWALGECSAIRARHASR